MGFGTVFGKNLLRNALHQTHSIKALGLSPMARASGSFVESSSSFAAKATGKDLTNIIKGNSAAKLARATEDLDYAKGMDVFHGSGAAGLKEIKPNVSVASQRNYFGLGNKEGVAFAYRGDTMPDDPTFLEGFVGRMSEAASESMHASTLSKTGEFTPTVYKARMPHSEVLRQQGMYDAGMDTSWVASRKPLRVTGEYPISTNVQETTRDIYPAIHKGRTVDQFYSEQSQENARFLADLIDDSDSVA
jgi:hypothetical protein